jgi:competence protein ComEA
MPQPQTTCSAPRSWVFRTGVFLLALLGCFPTWAQVQRDAAGESKWEVLSGSRLVTNQVVDGDSFHVMHEGREYVFRLYFVDAPESSPEFKERIEGQAAYFGISANDIPRAGQLASRFTREKLTGKDITIIMRYQNAMGRGSLPRYYAVVMVNGENLAEQLVASGLACIRGLKANWPDGLRSSTFISKLKNLEINARQKQLGVWNQSIFPLETDAVASEGGTNTAAASAFPTNPPVVEINSATFEELQKLPGIGPKLAERIIAHRPYQTPKDLDAVPGIGPATLKRLEPHIRIGSPPQ